ncbi:hypothetical protein BST61_g10263 [Cercospora zeina]
MQLIALILGAFSLTAWATTQPSLPSGMPDSGAAAPSDSFPELTTLLTAMKTDGGGFTHLADDGVLRSYTSDGTVLDALPLSNAQIHTLIDTRPPVWEPYHDELVRMFDSVDGNQVDASKHDVLLDPPVHLKPAVFSGPDHVMPELDSKLDELIKSKKIDATTVEEKVIELRKHSKPSDNQSANPLFLVKVDINKKPQLWCLGQICSSHDGCRFMGCNACIVIDAMLSKVKTCV